MARPLLAGVAFAALVFAAFRLAGHAFFFEGRTAANVQALAGALLGFGLGWLAARLFGGLAGAAAFAVPGLLVMAAATSHFGLAFPGIDPRLDKGFGGLMLWLNGFLLIGALTARRASTI